MSTIYLWLKAFHVIAVIAWMAGLLYLPRLFVYHCRAEVGSVSSDTFKVMERRLMRFIMTPAMMASWGFGIALIAMLGWDMVREAWWLAAKLGAVVVLTGVHVLLGVHLKAFAGDRNVRSERYFRVLNELPTALMIVIVILVIVRPF